MGAVNGVDVGWGASEGTTASAQHRVGCNDVAASQLGAAPEPILDASENPLSHAVLLHTKSLSISHPVERASRFSSSVNVHSRAPALSQNDTASRKLTNPLQPPRDKSLSPHTLLLPYNSALVQPSSSHDDADTATGTRAAVG